MISLNINGGGGSQKAIVPPLGKHNPLGLSNRLIEKSLNSARRDSERGREDNDNHSVNNDQDNKSEL